MNKNFISCDWGTSNFRLRLVAGSDYSILAEVENDRGVGVLSLAWQQQGGGAEPARRRLYLETLEAALVALKEKQPEMEDHLPIVISGMASSTIGLEELPYAPLPQALDGGGFSVKWLDDLPHPVLLVSGVCSADDVMRGEETQLAGLLDDAMKAQTGPLLVVHPGTHSKHMTVSGGRLTGFRTFMTGESFKLYTTHGILRSSVTAGPFLETPFRDGVAAAAANPLLHALFLIRTSDLFKKRTAAENYHYLSGILIGSELQNLQGEREQIYLCPGGSLHRPYSVAADALGLGATITEADWEEGAVIRGQAALLARHRRR